MQSFIGLGGLIFEINGKNCQFFNFFAIKTTRIDAVMLRIRCLCTVHKSNDIFAITLALPGKHSASYESASRLRTD